MHRDELRLSDYYKDHHYHGLYVLQELDLPFSRSRTVPTQSSPKTWKSLQYVTQCTCPLTVRARRL